MAYKHILRGGRILIDYGFVVDFLEFLATFARVGGELKEYQVIDFAVLNGIGIQELATIELLLFTAKIITKSPRRVGDSFVNLAPGALTKDGLKLVKQLKGQENNNFMIL